MWLFRKNDSAGSDCEKESLLLWRKDEERIEQDQGRIRRRVQRLFVLQVLLTICATAFLLWQYHNPEVVLQIEAPRHVSGIPQYVLDYAPLVWLDKAEAYFPSDMGAQITNTVPYMNRTELLSYPLPLTIHNIDKLNHFGRNGTNIFLTSAIDVREEPAFFDGVIPSATTHATEKAISCAIIITDKGNGTLDAFYMYFYAYNMGNIVLWHELGDHIGDWEHNMLRFVNGTPTEMWFSQHQNGQAFTYEAVEKIGKRPISYSARGSHANYAVPGTHDHTIPDFNSRYGFIRDYTSKGTLWDPTLSTYFYNYNTTSPLPPFESGRFESIDNSPIAAMNFRGKWGDQQYLPDDPRQKPKFFGFSKYVSGPTGPRDKQLDRDRICPITGFPCIVRKGLQVLKGREWE